MNWAEVVAHPSLKDLPFKIETNENGQIVMTSQKILQSVFRAQINYLLSEQKPFGITLTSCAVWTRRGTKCADVAWASAELFAEIQNKTEAQIAPEVCVEVLSMSNSEEEIKQKRRLYFEQGAREVWICDEYGKIRFFDEDGEMETSKMFADFPESVSSNIGK